LLSLVARRAPPAPFSTSLFATQIIRILLLISPAPGFLAAYENERVEEVASAASLDEAAALDEETASEDTDESSDGTERASTPVPSRLRKRAKKVRTVEKRGIIHKAMASTGLSVRQIDITLEHIHCAYKLDIRNFRNGTHDVLSTFNTATLTSSFNKALRAHLEGSYGTCSKTDHSTRSQNKDICSMALKMVAEQKCKPPQHWLLVEARSGKCQRVREVLILSMSAVR
jgi:hypothetical protein